MRDTCRFRHLSSNGVIAKIILFDPDILFEGKKINLISETVRDIAKMYAFINFGIYHRMVSLQKFRDLDLPFQGKKINILYL